MDIPRLEAFLETARLGSMRAAARSLHLGQPFATTRSGKVRRCKLYFLRDRVGKARRLRERRISAEQRRIAAEARAAKARAMREAEEAVAAAKSTETAEASAGAEEMAGTPTS